MGCESKKEKAMSDEMIGKEAVKEAVACPYCRSSNTEFFSLFGQQLLTIQYYCNACHTPFEYIKDDNVAGDVGMAHVALVQVSPLEEGPLC
jgi:DNA-directed RNA polymerase subunit RPC12/RpoP